MSGEALDRRLHWELAHANGIQSNAADSRDWILSSRVAWDLVGAGLNWSPLADSPYDLRIQFGYDNNHETYYDGQPAKDYHTAAIQLNFSF